MISVCWYQHGHSVICSVARHTGIYEKISWEQYHILSSSFLCAPFFSGFWVKFWLLLQNFTRHFAPVGVLSKVRMVQFLLTRGTFSGLTACSCTIFWWQLWKWTHGNDMTGSFSCTDPLRGISYGQMFIATPLVGGEGTGVTCVNRLPLFNVSVFLWQKKLKTRAGRSNYNWRPCIISPGSPPAIRLGLCSSLFARVIGCIAGLPDNCRTIEAFDIQHPPRLDSTL